MISSARRSPLVRFLATVVLALALAGGLLLALGYPPLDALAALADGAFGSAAGWTATLLKSGPLLLTGLAVALSFRCGVWNIGAEGQLLGGALLATAVATRCPPGTPAWLLLPAVVLAGAAGGALFGAAAGALRALRGVSEVITTILLNFVALHLVALAVQGPLQESAGTYPQSEIYPGAARLPALGRVHLGIPGAVLAALGVHALVFRTRLGFRLRAVGLAPEVAQFSGISPARYGFLVLAVAGALAGLAGAFEVSGVTLRLYERISPGYGYTAIAVALLARLHPLAVIPSALFFGALEAGGGSMQRVAGVPSVVTEIVQALVILMSVGFVLAGPARRGASALHDDAAGPV